MLKFLQQISYPEDFTLRIHSVLRIEKKFSDVKFLFKNNPHTYRTVRVVFSV